MMTLDDFEAQWHELDDAREEQAYQDDKAEQDREMNFWYFESLINSTGCLHRHDHHDGRCFVITRDDTVTGALIWPVFVYEFNQDRDRITLTRLTSVQSGFEWIDEQVKPKQAA